MHCPKGHNVTRIDTKRLRDKFLKWKTRSYNMEAYRYCRECDKFYYIGDVYL